MIYRASDGSEWKFEHFIDGIWEGYRITSLHRETHEAPWVIIGEKEVAEEYVEEWVGNAE